MLEPLPELDFRKFQAAELVLALLHLQVEDPRHVPDQRRGSPRIGGIRPAAARGRAMEEDAFLFTFDLKIRASDHLSSTSTNAMIGTYPLHRLLESARPGGRPGVLPHCAVVVEAEVRRALIGTGARRWGPRGDTQPTGDIGEPEIKICEHCRPRRICHITWTTKHGMRMHEWCK